MKMAINIKEKRFHLHFNAIEYYNNHYYANYYHLINFTLRKVIIKKAKN